MRLAPGVLYFPPRPIVRSEIIVYEKVVRRLITWARETLAMLRTGVIPLLFMDLNDEFVITEESTDGMEHPIGATEPATEHFTAGLIRQLCKETGLAVWDSFYQTGPTFWKVTGAGGTKVDHILGPADVMSTLQGMTIFKTSGRRLQLANRLRPWDHWPLVATLHAGVGLVPTPPFQPQKEWGQGALRQCLLSGVHRQDLLNSLEAAFVSNSDVLTGVLEDEPSVDKLDKLFVDTVKQAALPIFGAGPAPPEAHAHSLVHELSDLLQERRLLKDQLAAWDFSVDGGLCMIAAIQDQLDTTQWRLIHISRELKRRKRKKIADEREQAEAEINEHWRSRHTKTCWKGAMRMCRTAPRRRLQRFDVLIVRGATQREWVDQMTKPGQHGGCIGAVIDLEVEQSKLTTKESMETDEQYRQQITPDDLDAAESLSFKTSVRCGVTPLWEEHHRPQHSQ